MASWIRYSIAVYMGLLLAGALVNPRGSESVGSAGEQQDFYDHRLVSPALPSSAMEVPAAIRH